MNGKDAENKGDLCSAEREKQGINAEEAVSKTDGKKPGSALLEAAEYVEAVLSAQQVSAVLRTPIPSGRKRHLSLPAAGESDLKKIRSDDLSVSGEEDDKCDADRQAAHNANAGSRNFVRARRNLLTKQDDDSRSNNSFETEKILAAMGELRVGLEQKIEGINRSNSEKFEAMTAEIEKTRMDFNKRIEGLAKKVETQVMKSITKTVETKINSLKTGTEKKIEKLQKTCDLTNKKVLKLKETTLATMKEEMGDELDELHKKLNKLETTVSETRQSNNMQNDQADRKRNIVIRNLDEREHENVLLRANNVISEGLKLRNISFESATRKISRNNSKPGIIIATCKTDQDKESIMSVKRELKNSSRYQKVFVENDLPPGQRKLNSNLRTIVNTIGRDKLLFKGSRILPAETGQGAEYEYGYTGTDYQGRRVEEENRSYEYDRMRNRGNNGRDDRYRGQQGGYRNGEK